MVLASRRRHHTDSCSAASKPCLDGNNRVNRPLDPQSPRAEIHRGFLSYDPTCCDLPFCVTWILIRSPPRHLPLLASSVFYPWSSAFPLWILFILDINIIVTELCWKSSIDSEISLSQTYAHKHTYTQRCPPPMMLKCPIFHHSHLFGSKKWRDYN